jgi:hypothetical protein
MSIRIKLLATTTLLALLAGCASPPPPAPLQADSNRAGGAAGYWHPAN